MNTDTFAGCSIAIIAFHALTVEVTSSTIKWTLGFWSTVHCHTVQSICKTIHIYCESDVLVNIYFLVGTCNIITISLSSLTKMSVVGDLFIHILIVICLGYRRISWVLDHGQNLADSLATKPGNFGNPFQTTSNGFWDQQTYPDWDHKHSRIPRIL